MLYREPMWLKSPPPPGSSPGGGVSVLYREPMWLKSTGEYYLLRHFLRFSALP